MEKMIITAAVTGSLPTKKKTPHVPITPAEIVAAGVRCEQAGAAVIHVHARNPKDESPSTDVQIFKEIYQGLKERTNLIIQISTGGRAGMAYEQRSDRLALRPEMASLTTGSVNFPAQVYENPPDFVEGLAKTMLEYGIKPEIEVFDLAMLYNAANLVKKGLLNDPPHVQFVMGVPNAMPARRSIFDFLRSEIEDVLPNATWVAAGVGRAQWEVNQWCLETGGHCRTGLEDNLKITPDRLAASNAELVKKIADNCERFGRRVAKPAEARDILGLRPA